ncbi:TetR/AcrR family transcriptional regulator [Saccharopolyspora erythraea]|uniref:TetR/AcrR family transcriptional regulator n=1 Tax=Saccharopolyspora erythraea TaxID=1836 RepID=UPI001BA4E6EB|nr:TetR/AcrR family transcriptional regulator [Saccharopolyspora erythraea]QUH04156.1 TetR/AcrR family transcriptional regulator [Saccharopolyspora erythraea]
MTAAARPTPSAPDPETSEGNLDRSAAVSLRRRQIMVATERLIAEQGFDALRLRDVAKAAGVSIGTIQHYFDTRDNLVLETLAAASWRRAEEFTAQGKESTDPVERTRSLLRGSIADRARCQAWMETCASSTRHSELAPMIERIYEAWRVEIRQAIKDGIDAGIFNPHLPLEQLIDTVMAMIEGLMVTVGLSLDRFTSDYAATLVQDTAGRLLAYDFKE